MAATRPWLECRLAQRAFACGVCGRQWIRRKFPCLPPPLRQDPTVDIRGRFSRSQLRPLVHAAKALMETAQFGTPLPFLRDVMNGRSGQELTPGAFLSGILEWQI